MTTKHIQKVASLKHGILSQEIVLPWEDSKAYQVLLEGLINDHQPSGATEQYLVEELANIIWRKKRLLKALKVNQRTKLHENSQSRLCHNLDETVQIATMQLNEPSLDGIQYDHDMLAACLKDTPEVIKERLVKKERDYQQIRLFISDTNDIENNTLLEDSLSEYHDQWLDWVEYSDLNADTASLISFINDEAIPSLLIEIGTLKLHGIVLDYIADKACQINPADEQLVRYESHLDRKLEKTLAMLIKLNEPKVVREQQDIIVQVEKSTIDALSTTPEPNKSTKSNKS